MVSKGAVVYKTATASTVVATRARAEAAMEVRRKVVEAAVVRLLEAQGESRAVVLVETAQPPRGMA